MIRIASAQGFWGDWPQAPGLQVRSGPIDYLVFDYLAEVTMSILQKQRLRDASMGYARDFVDVMTDLMADLLSFDVKVVSNAGGANPLGCARELLARLRPHDPDGAVRVGVVHGDDVMGRLTELKLVPLDHEAPAFGAVRDRLLSANVYFGAEAVVRALREGCRFVITGRVTDTGLTLAPMIREFDIADDDWNRRALGIVAGHILECGAQSTGGNFLGRRLSNAELLHVGFPIAEYDGGDSVVITKHDALGGEVSTSTVKEQLLYEIGDPTRYITPDVVVDFSSIRVESAGSNRVRVYGVKGSAPTDTYKVSCAYADGYLLTGTIVYAWPDAVGKARQAGELVIERARALGLSMDDTRVEAIGADACHGAIARAAGGEAQEVQLRVAVRGRDRKALERLGQEIVPLVLTGPPGATGFAGGRPRPSDVAAYWPGLLDKRAVAPELSILSASETGS